MFDVQINESYIVEQSGTSEGTQVKYKKYDYFGKGFDVDYAGVIDWLKTEPQSTERDVLIYQVRRYRDVMG